MKVEDLKRMRRLKRKELKALVDHMIDHDDQFRDYLALKTVVEVMTERWEEKNPGAPAVCKQCRAKAPSAAEAWHAGWDMRPMAPDSERQVAMCPKCIKLDKLSPPPQPEFPFVSTIPNRGLV